MNPYNNLNRIRYQHNNNRGNYYNHGFGNDVNILMPPYNNFQSQIKQSTNDLKNTILKPVNNVPYKPSYIYVHEDVAYSNYMENILFYFIFIVIIFLLISIICCRFKLGIKLIRNVLTVFSWIFWAILSLILKFLVCILQFIRKMIDWLWETTTFGSTGENFNFWYWGPKKERTIIIDGVSHTFSTNE